MAKPNLVVISGSGISAESGLSTFRALGGLWEQHKIEEVASPAAWARNPQLVLDFYNARRRALSNVEPNEAHRICARLESRFRVNVITQNVDDLHERGGSSSVLHLHGELRKARSQADPDCVVELGARDIGLGDLAPDGAQLRPDIVWFGEPVSRMPDAEWLIVEAEVCVVVGTSLQVYPAAGLVDLVLPGVPIFLVDPDPPLVKRDDVVVIQSEATTGMQEVARRLESWNQQNQSNAHYR